MLAIAARELSPSKLKPFFTISHVFLQSPRIRGTNSSISRFFSPFLHHPHWNKTPESPSFSASCFCSSSTSSSSSSSSDFLPLTRDGNYDDATPVTAVCPGCGIHVQDSDPKHPGFYIRPSMKKQKSDLNRILKSNRHLVPVSQETEFTDSIKRGLIVEPRIVDPDSKEEAEPESADGRPVVCARCHSLRHYGKVKDPTVENLLPDFDFDHTVGRRLGSPSGARTVVLMVVDASDFDGSFPKRVAKLVSRTIDENQTAWKEGKSGNIPRVVLVVTKIDLLPSSLSPTRFEHWVRQRAREGGLSKIAKLHFVSPVKNWGIKDLVEDVAQMAGKRGHVWAVGAQNAGKSTLINAVGKAVGGKVTHLTEAPVPGTTLGIIRVEGVLPFQAKLFDSPGLLNPHQITTRLTREEQKLVYVSKELKPRTYRIKEGYTIHIGGLMRLDIDELSVDSVYVTVWASSYIPLHMGKKENAHKILQDHFGLQLQPPIGQNRVQELGKWVRKEFRVKGDNWDASSVDIAASGLGWFAIGLKGEAILSAWTYEGIDLFVRNSLLPQRSQTFEDSGFTVSKVVAKADQSLIQMQKETQKKQRQNDGNNPEPRSSSNSFTAPSMTC
ncbi:PREDICTED: GTP-binding protein BRASSINAZOLE INSENSITIVE PALE GREEN 2, chloroplastic [Tarenaya hassleriana]|uniref:GTP-binding protein BRASSINAZOLE INSENSITIVE PALE GREEN 2, chloroplastic n=1 Tax=Tarenaya hassleriana TaxID=28532 RepID=UPI00053C08F3|nr:PREDICTED: GTP-binding protein BRASSINAZOLE INSENSITIVE PALE GREEN 2, chloroplastic [Tarenaya hassleriana]